MRIRLLVKQSLYFNSATVLLWAMAGLAVAGDSAGYLEEAHRIADERETTVNRQSAVAPFDWATKASQSNEVVDEAMSLYDRIRANQNVPNPRSEGSGAKDRYSTLVFVSRSLGNAGLQDVLGSAAGKDDTVVVFRGIPEGASLSQAIMDVQRMAREYEDVPNIIVDPTLFRDHNVSVVPTIIHTHRGGPSKDEKVHTRIEGISDALWIERNRSRVEKGVVNREGPVKEISEPDLIKVAQERLANIDWEEKKQKAKDGFWKGQTFQTLPTATTSQSRVVDLSVYVTKDIIAPDGTYLAREGDVINPLDKRPFTQALVVFDPTDERQMQAVQKELPRIRKRPGVRRITFMATRFDTERGWESYKVTSDSLDSPVYLLTSDVMNRFEIQRSPSVVTAQGSHIIVEEIGIEEGERQYD